MIILEGGCHVPSLTLGPIDLLPNEDLSLGRMPGPIDLLPSFLFEKNKIK
jgi:hypothetical protein